jgi:hypothetical protein
MKQVWVCVCVTVIIALHRQRVINKFNWYVTYGNRLCLRLSKLGNHVLILHFMCNYAFNVEFVDVL